MQNHKQNMNRFDYLKLNNTFSGSLGRFISPSQVNKYTLTGRMFKLHTERQGYYNATSDLFAVEDNDFIFVFFVAIRIHHKGIAF